MRERYGVRLVSSLILLLLVANTINIGADIGAMAAAAQLIISLPFVILTSHLHDLHNCPGNLHALCPVREDAEVAHDLPPGLSHHGVRGS
jgi:hypothetical protein